jgi:hypothetical protein
MQVNRKLSFYILHFVLISLSLIFVTSRYHSCTPPPGNFAS